MQIQKAGTGVFLATCGLLALTAAAPAAVSRVSETAPNPDTAARRAAAAADQFWAELAEESDLRPLVASFAQALAEIEHRSDLLGRDRLAEEGTLSGLAEHTRRLLDRLDRPLRVGLTVDERSALQRFLRHTAELWQVLALNAAQAVVMRGIDLDQDARDALDDASLTATSGGSGEATRRYMEAAERLTASGGSGPGEAALKNEKCRLGHVVDRGTVIRQCVNKCDPVFRMDGDECKQIQPNCVHVTHVSFKKGEIVNRGSEECICVVPGKAGDPCRIQNTIVGGALQDAQCVGQCDPHFKDPECKKPAKVECEMISDHANHQTGCVCEAKQ